ERASEIRITTNIIIRIRLKLRLKCVGIDLDVESTQMRKAAVSKVLVRPPYWVVENVVEVRAKRSGYALADLEVFVQPKVYCAPKLSSQHNLTSLINSVNLNYIL